VRFDCAFSDERPQSTNSNFYIIDANHFCRINCPDAGDACGVVLSSSS